MTTKKNAAAEKEYVAGLGVGVTGHPRLTLAALRELIVRGTQAELSEESDIAQGDVSKLEARELDGVQVSTLRRYAEGLGGDLVLVIAVKGQCYEVAPAADEHQLTGAYLRLERKRAGLSQSDLAKILVHFSVDQIDDAENGHPMNKRFLRSFLDACHGRSVFGREPVPTRR
jgi:transcriptional regulator with XRE-family HTH domain